MKLKKKELQLLWVTFYLSVIFMGTFLEHLNEIKSNEKDDVVIFGVTMMLWFVVITTILQFFYMSDEPTPIDVQVLWFIFTLIMSLCAMNPHPLDERLETFHYFGCGVVQLYVIYLYEAHSDLEGDRFGRSYLKRVFLRIKRLGRVRPREFRPYG